MDSSAIERAGADPLKNELARIDAIASREDLARALARGHHHGWDPLFNFGGTPDFKNSTMVIAAASQGGLGLPDRDYYVRDDSTARALRAAYLAYIGTILSTLGDEGPVIPSEAMHILRLETALAQASLTRVERRDPNADRKSTRLNSSHSQISYAAFCLKKKYKDLPEADLPAFERTSIRLLHRRSLRLPS